MSTLTNHQWRVAARPVGRIKESDYSFVEEPVPDLADGQMRVRVDYLSLDPANRGWLNEGGSYMPEIPLGAVMPAMGIGTVEESRNSGFQAGDLVQGLPGWQEYLISDGKGLQKLPQVGLDPTAFLGLFGHIGLTAYFGLIDVGRPKAGETLVVSGAAGAVGSIVGQIGKIIGCRVVGIAGSDEKCSWIKNDLGFDEAINYKTGPVYQNLKRACPNGIDVYFENVGGEILEAVLAQINNFARISLCGMISQYNATKPTPGPSNFINLLVRRVTLQGFIVTDFLPRANEGITKLMEWYQQGKLKYRVDIIEGLAEAPRAVNKLFDGANQGKLILKVSK